MLFDIALLLFTITAFGIPSFYNQNKLQFMRLLFVCLLLISKPIYSQSHRIIDTCVLECQYDFFMVKDTLNRKVKSQDIMILKIGQEASVFYSFHKFYGDSLANSPSGQKVLGKMILEAVSKGNYKAIPGGARNSMEYIYKNHPKGANTIRTEMMTNHFEYEEPLEKQQWRIVDSTRNILGYSCQKAVCNFRGRHYIGWFTTEIPVSNGPWKFSGLPGLLVEVYDKNNDYWFILKGIQKSKESLLFYDFASPNSYIKTNRKSFLRRKANLYFKKQGNNYIKASTGVDLNLGISTKKNNYDFMERDH